MRIPLSPPSPRSATRLAALAALAALATLATACSLDDAPEAAHAPDDDAPLATATAEQAGSAYRPMGFARVTAFGSVLTGFNSSNAAVTAVRTSVGKYTVAFANLGHVGSFGGVRGNVQLTAEGANSNHCHVRDWTSFDLHVVVRVECFSVLATAPAADTAFTVLYVREAASLMPGTATRSAYAFVPPSGALNSLETYNSSNGANTVTWTSPGRAVLTISGAATPNASIMVTPHFNSSGGPGAASCALVSWNGNRATIECRSHTAVLVNTPFTFLFSTTGPSIEQQSGHGLFNGSALAAETVGALGKIAGCSPAAVTQTRTDSLIHLTLSGELGSWDTSPFLRATLATKLGAAGYCKLEALTVSGAAPTTTATSSIRCYSSMGRVVEFPGIWYTHTTSAPSGPC